MIRFLTCASSATALALAVTMATPEAQAKTAAHCLSGHRGSVCATEASKSPRPQKLAKAKKPIDPHAPALDATTLACNDEYEANKAAIDGGGQSKAKFVKDCKNGTEKIPGNGIAAGAPPPAVDGPPPDKPLPPASLTSGRPIATSDAGQPKLK